MFISEAGDNCVYKDNDFIFGKGIFLPCLQLIKRNECDGVHSPTAAEMELVSTTIIIVLVLQEHFCIYGNFLLERISTRDEQELDY